MKLRRLLSNNWQFNLTKGARILKISVLLSIIMTFSTFANSVVYSQVEISIDVENTEITSILDFIESTTALRFFYDNDIYDFKQKRTLSLKKVKIEEAISLIFEDNLDFKLSENIVILKKAIKSTPVKNNEINTDKDQDELQKTISGSITDKDGNPLPGATVIEKGTSNGITSDFDGNYELKISNPNATIVVSYIGFDDVEVDVEGQQNINISLVETTESLDEIVVTGYGTVKKSDATGAISSLKADDINVGAIVSVDQMMQGRAAGVQISQSSSEPGGGLSIRIRGASSVNASNEPLYVIDGFPIDNSPTLSGSGGIEVGIGGDSTANIATNRSPRNPLNSINPNDIERIEILKDASATAIYGSRGANGVVLITTKRGDEGKLNVNYNTYVGTSQIVNAVDVMSTNQYMDFMDDILPQEGDAAPFTNAATRSAIGAGTDWQNQIYRTAMITDHNLSVSGGMGKSRVYASLNYFEQEGIVKNTGIKKYIGRINLDTEISEKINIGFNLNSSLIEDSNGRDGLSTNESAGPIYGSLLYDPTEPVYNADGTFARSPNLTTNNPMSTLMGVFNSSETNRAMANFYINYKPIDGLIAKINLGSDRSNMRRDVYNSRATILGGPVGGIADISTLSRSSYLGEFTLDYTKDFNEDHTINALSGITYQKFKNRIFMGNIQNMPTDALQTNALQLGDTNYDNLSSLKEENTLLSYLARVNYTFRDKILFTASIRADGSSRFGSDEKYGYFPSFALGYKLTDEAFIPDVFNELKIRTSWGQTGNQEIGNYASQLTFGAGNNAVLGGSIVGTVRPARLANTALKWETTTQLNIGIDYAILNNRITGTIDYFKKNTTDMLFNLPLPAASGYSSILSNIGEVENSGIEFLINSGNITTPDFTWSTSFNLTSIKNEVKDLGGIGQVMTGNVQAVGNTSIIKVGHPIGSYFGYEVDGIQQSGDTNPGYPNFVDQTGEGDITPADAKIIGNPAPDLIYGINNTFQYKNFGLSFFIQAVQGADLLNINIIESMYPANRRRNRLADIALDRWTPSNTGAKWPSGANSNRYDGDKVNTLTLQDASFIRLKNVQFSYNVPVNDSNLFNSLRIYVSGQNLFTITDYIGFDPEANSFGQSNVRVDYSSFPLASTVMIGLNAQF